MVFDSEICENSLKQCVLSIIHEHYHPIRVQYKMMKFLQSLALHFCKLPQSSFNPAPMELDKCQIINILAYQQPTLRECAIVSCLHSITERLSFSNYPL
jgi:hypothetical protein